MKPIKSPHKRTHITISGERIENGKRMAEMTRTWMERHESEFRALMGFVKSLQSLDRVGRVRDRVAVWCMANGVTFGGGPTKFGNDYWAGAARYMVLLDPSLDGAPLNLADSDIDCYGLLPVSWMEGEIKCA